MIGYRSDPFQLLRDTVHILVGFHTIYHLLPNSLSVFSYFLVMTTVTIHYCIRQQHFMVVQLTFLLSSPAHFPSPAPFFAVACLFYAPVLDAIDLLLHYSNHFFFAKDIKIFMKNEKKVMYNGSVWCLTKRVLEGGRSIADLPHMIDWFTSVTLFLILMLQTSVSNLS